MLQLKPVQAFSLILMAALLGGCGGSDTNIVEKDPIIIDDGDDHNHEEHGDGRLLISTKGEALVSVIDIHEKTVLDEFVLSDVVSAIYASPSKRYGYVVQRTADKVNVIDGGLWQEDHGDHLHDYAEAPLLMSFQTDYSRPTHFTDTDSQTVIFFDGNAATTTPATVGVFTEADLAANGTGVLLEYDLHMHGAAQARGDYLLSTQRDAESETTLPSRVALYHAHDGHFDEELVFEEGCPGLHGSAQNHEFVAFGCTDGVLVIEQDGDTFSAIKLPNPESFAEGTRIGTLIGDEHLDVFVGIAAGEFFAVDSETSSITPIEWTEIEASAISYDFIEHGEVFVILDNLGRLTLLAVDSNWDVLAQFQVITSNITAMPEGSRFEIALTPGHMAYVSDPIANQINIVNLDEAEVVDTIQLDFIPEKLTWLGISEPSDDNHEH